MSENYHILPTVYMLCGLPASGKSTYAKEIAKNDNTEIFSSDAIRKELYGSEEDQQNPQKVFQILHKRVKTALQNGNSAVYDATNLVSKRRKAFLDELKKIPCKKVCILFMQPKQELLDRDSGRDRHVGEHVIDRMLKQFEPPMYSEGWDEIHIIWSHRRMFIPQPYSKALLDFDQQNSHHSLTLGKHMRKADGNIGDMIFERELDLSHEQVMHLHAAAYWHDIGKYYTQVFHDGKGNPTEEAHYYGHEKVGSYIYLLHCNQILQEMEPNIVDTMSGYNKNNDSCLYTASLIAWHMRPFVWEQAGKVKEKDRKRFGDRFVQDLELLHEADKNAC